MPKILILNGHPEADGLTAELADSYQASARRGAEVERLDLRTLQFDLVLRRQHAERPLEPDLLRAQDAILRAEHVVWMFPTWWSGAPALMKGFCERVLTSGFAFRYRARHQTPERLLRGRSARCISSMDSPGFWYRFVQNRPLHNAFLHHTLGFAGFSPLSMTMFHEARFMSEGQRRAACVRVAKDAEQDVRRLVAPSPWSWRRPYFARARSRALRPHAPPALTARAES
jgi:putative NADPH-quinone reductase